jgi:hypothetical protein
LISFGAQSYEQKAKEQIFFPFFCKAIRLDEYIGIMSLRSVKKNDLIEEEFPQRLFC